VMDDGHGMTKDDAVRGFGRVGGSWKRSAATTRTQHRSLHGKHGQGRYAAFSLGGQITWISVAADGDIGHGEILITGDRNDLRRFEISDSKPSTRSIKGTRVVVRRLDERAVAILGRDDIVDNLTAIFAIYLESYSQVTWGGTKLDPSRLQEHRVEYPLTVPGMEGKASLTVIEWNAKIDRAIFLCDSDGMALHQISPGIWAPGFDFTAYLRWNGFRDLGRDIHLLDFELEQAAPLLECARRTLREHFRLDRTTLSTLISTSRKIGDRLDFLAGLNALVFDTESNRQTLERRQLHRILAEETWIFAEEYALTGDDDRLLQVLRGHAEILGDDIDFTDSRTPPRRADGRDAIPDLVLSRKVEQHQNRIEHIVIELKRPKIDIGVAQINQIESYALAVLDDPRFTQANVFWDFWVVGVRVDKYAEMRRNQDSLPHGFIQRSGRYSIQVRTWAEVIGDAEHRLKFVARNLEYRSSRDQGIQYLRDTHSKYLPSALRPDEGK
ncbi:MULTISPECIES: ATP-binding protein, partial [unclassified Frankia]|uniref:ATP-binding protein n=1 Tax=unclassified Frankia TaxID=2632575 RepID=UPI002AD251BE